jgi:hypothetical protein
VACCVVAQVAILRGIILRGATRATKDESAAGGVPRPARAAEFAWTVAPAIALAAVLAVTWRALPHAR